MSKQARCCDVRSSSPFNRISTARPLDIDFHCHRRTCNVMKTRIGSTIYRCLQTPRLEICSFHAQHFAKRRSACKRVYSQNSDDGNPISPKSTGKNCKPSSAAHERDEKVCSLEMPAARRRWWIVWLLTYLLVLGAHRSIMFACCHGQSCSWGLAVCDRLCC